MRLGKVVFAIEYLFPFHDCWLRPWTVSNNIFHFLISLNVKKNQLAKTFTSLKEIKAPVWVGVGCSFIHLSLRSIFHALFRESTKLTCLFPKSLTSLSFKKKVRRISIKSNFRLTVKRSLLDSICKVWSEFSKYSVSPQTPTQISVSCHQSVI